MKDKKGLKSIINWRNTPKISRGENSGKPSPYLMDEVGQFPSDRIPVSFWDMVIQKKKDVIQKKKDAKS